MVERPTTVEVLAAEVAQLRLDFDATTADLAGQLADLEDVVTKTPAPAQEAAKSAPAATPAPLAYPDVGTWISQHFVHVYARAHGGEFRWCAQWWDHPEAITRLTALWRSWEHFRLQPLGVEQWIRERLDHHLPILMGSQGPFVGCTPDRHLPTRPMLIEPVPPGWQKAWDQVAARAAQGSSVPEPSSGG